MPLNDPSEMERRGTGRRPRLTPPIADARRAVRSALTSAGLSRDALVLVGLSGGADSLALAAALAFEAPRNGIRAGALVVDHGIQPGSAGVAERAAGQARALGLDPVLVERVVVTGGGAGPEAGARTARHAAFDRAREGAGAERILLGHTLDDQAETVLLGLARGSGPASLRGMLSDTGRLLRPFLGLRRAALRAVCADSGLEPWDDPHNEDAAFTRVRVRRRALPALERELGPGVAEALARTAEQLREDDEALDDLARKRAQKLMSRDVMSRAGGGLAPGENGLAADATAVALDAVWLVLDAVELAAEPAGLRQRIIRLAAAELGVSLSRAHTLAVAELVIGWRGQGPLTLPGIRVVRQNGKLIFLPNS